MDGERAKSRRSVVLASTVDTPGALSPSLRRSIARLTYRVQEYVIILTPTHFHTPRDTIFWAPLPKEATVPLPLHHDLQAHSLHKVRGSVRGRPCSIRHWYKSTFPSYINYASTMANMLHMYSGSVRLSFWTENASRTDASVATAPYRRI